MDARFFVIIVLILGMAGAGFFVVFQAQSHAEAERDRALEQAREARRNAGRLAEIRSDLDDRLDTAPTDEPLAQEHPALPANRATTATVEASDDLATAIDQLTLEVARTRQTLDARLERIEQALLASSGVSPSGGTDLETVIARKEAERVASEIAKMRALLGDALASARAGQNDEVDIPTMEQMLSELDGIASTEDFSNWRERWQHVFR